MTYLIGSKAISVHTDNSLASTTLLQELQLYPTTDKTPDLIINFSPSFKRNSYAKNPSTYEEVEGGFVTDHIPARVTWLEGSNPAQVLVEFKGNYKSLIKKLLSKQYTHPYEEIGLCFHDLILITSFLLYFPEEVSIIHGSAVESPKSGHGIIVGGTGGVGKTTTELELILSKGYKFLSDDMALVDSHGFIWPNFSYPKIYGYNTNESPLIKKRLFQHRGIFDRLWWQISLIRGTDRIRRRLSPTELSLQSGVSHGANLKKLILLFRRNIYKPIVKDVPVAKVVDMNLAVIQGEIKEFIGFLFWQEFNRTYFGCQALNFHDLLDKWRLTQIKALQNVDTQVIEIPYSFQSAEVKRHIVPLISDY